MVVLCLYWLSFKFKWKLLQSENWIIHRFYQGHLTVHLSSGPLIYVLICLEESSSNFNFEINPYHLQFILLFLKIVFFSSNGKREWGLNSLNSFWDSRDCSYYICYFTSLNGLLIFGSKNCYYLHFSIS